MRRTADNKPDVPPLKLRISRTHKPDDLGVEEWQRLLRKQFGEQQDFRINNMGEHPIFSEFALFNPLSGRTYRVAIRGQSAGENYCSCPDFSINNLGTCKHIEFILSSHLKKRNAKKVFREGFRQPYSEVYLSYGLKRQVKFKAGTDMPVALVPLIEEYFDRDGILRDDRILDFPRFLLRLPKQAEHDVRCYDDVLAYIGECQDADHRRRVVDDRLEDGIRSPLFDHLLKTHLYPYQREGALFAVRAGRCLIGDDMGLGKTVQAIGAVELLVRLFHVGKVLVISPTSLKHQWKAEIEKFTARSATVIEGLDHQRRRCYEDGAFYKLLNYELVHRDITHIARWAPDVVILDEAQRIKNWKTRTAQCVKRLESPFALVLTGTPIENRIEELHSIMEFVDRYRLGPLYRFVHNHRVTDSGGKVVGYRDLRMVRESLSGVMMRRRKDEVLKQLPQRIDKNFYIPMTKEQRVIHDENYDIVAKIAAKWRRYRFLSDADQRRLQIALNFMRMSADNTYLVDKRTIHGPKIEELEVLLREIVIEGGEKAVIFSQWLRMTELVERMLERMGVRYVHLNGSVPSKQRRDLMTSFREHPDCKVFLSTDAGGVGLNLQSGSIVINMDVPWNPAVLEQRIGRVHRLGQRKTVRVINFISAASIEEKILDLIRFKKSLFTGALDTDGEDVVMVGESQFKRFMNSVAMMTADLKKPDPAYEDQVQKEAEIDKKAAETIGDISLDEHEMTEERRHAEDALTALGTFLAQGAQVLTTLSNTLSRRPGQHSAGTFNNLIAHDDKTGETYLRIPLPPKEMLSTALSALGMLFRSLHSPE